MIADNQTNDKRYKAIMSSGVGVKSLLPNMQSTVLIPSGNLPHIMRRPEIPNSARNRNKEPNLKAAYYAVTEILETEKQSNLMYKIYDEHFAIPCRIIVDQEYNVTNGKEGKGLYPSRSSLINISDKILEYLGSGEQHRTASGQSIPTIETLATTFSKLAPEMGEVFGELVKSNDDMNTYSKPMKDSVELKAKIERFCRSKETELHINNVCQCSYDVMQQQPIKRFMNYGSLLKNVLDNLDPDTVDYSLVQSAHYQILSLLKKVDETETIETLPSSITVLIGHKYKVYLKC